MISQLVLSGNMDKIATNRFVDMTYEYENIKGKCSLCLQGQSSLVWDKKNYTIKFEEPIQVLPHWGKQSIYCLKANFIDCTHARNIVSARLWGEVVKSRKDANANLLSSPNYGAIDGFPIIIILNNQFLGLYTWNIPQAGWLFGISDNEIIHQAFVGANSDTRSTRFQHTASFFHNIDYKIEYCANENNSWVKPSINNMLFSIIDSDGSNIDTEIKDFLDINSAIDYMIFSVLTTNFDGVTKNFQLVTYDGTQWIFSAYDLDGTFGLWWNGKYYIDISNPPTFISWKKNHLMDILLKTKKDIIYSRYNELRETILSENNIYNQFSNFISSIPEEVRRKDLEKWPLIPSQEKNNLNQIMNQYKERSNLMDEEIRNLF